MSRTKSFVVKRYLKLDDLLFEGVGLWQGEGGKSKGLYFGNSCVEVLLHFLKFVEERIGLSRNQFKVTLNVPKIIQSEEEIKRKWSEILKIPVENFTRVCVDSRINLEYAQLYINGIILYELMKNLHEKLKSNIHHDKKFTIPYLRGLFAAEGSVILKYNKTLFHVDFSAKDKTFIQFIKESLNQLEIKYGKYSEQGRKFPIYGKRNFERFKEFNLHILHPDKKSKFEFGFSNYQRELSTKEEMTKKILEQLLFSQMTYAQLSKNLNKGRSTIQYHYILLLIEKELVKFIGKTGRSLLFEITEKGKEFLLILNQ